MTRLTLGIATALALAAVVQAAPAQAQNGALTRSFVSSGGVDTNACTITAPCASFAQAYTKVGATIPLRRVGTADDVAAAITACCTSLRYATGSVFVVDSEHNEIRSVVAQGVEDSEIRLKIGNGIAGTVAFGPGQEPEEGVHHRLLIAGDRGN